MDERADERRFWASLTGLLGLAVVIAFGTTGLRCEKNSVILLRGEVVDRMVQARKATGHWPQSDQDPSYKPGTMHSADLAQVQFNLKYVDKSGSREVAHYWTVFHGVGRDTPVRLDLRTKG
jgi:hypothetical protein